MSNNREKQRWHRKLINVTSRTAKKYIASAVVLVVFSCGLEREAAEQEFLPKAPTDQTRIYFLDENKLVPLPFEQGTTSLDLRRPAKETRVYFIELKGEHATTVFGTPIPRLFLFTPGRVESRPPFLVSLRAHRGSRRLTALAQRGLSGFAVTSEEIIKPTIRVLGPSGDRVFMEIRPRSSLTPGEYAMIGNDLARIATFRISAGKQ